MNHFLKIFELMSDTEDSSDTEAEVEAICRESLTVSSRSTYRSRILRFKNWLQENKPHLLNDDGEIDLRRLKVKHFLKYIKDWKLEDPEKGIARYLTTRSALTTYWKDNAGCSPPESFEVRVSKFFKGLKRTMARERANGERNMKEGKDPLPFGLYRWICKEFMKSGDYFSLCYGTLCWNLMCRTSNTAAVGFSHIKLIDDAVAISFAHMKNDLEGEGLGRDYKHIYANPIFPECCPVLSMGLYLLTLGHSQHKLFPGTRQETRFMKSIHKLLQTPVGLQKLREYGVNNVSDIGSHSFRKGAATYVSSGCVGGPSIVSLCRRTGWALGHVLDRYLKFEGAGDQFLGRLFIDW